VPALLASYRLERSGGLGHDEAITRAFDLVNQTQFNYSSSNKAPFFNRPLVKLMTQFKQYPIHVIRLYTEQIGKAVRNLEPGDRAEAIRSLAYLSATHVAMAGLLGLPTEPFKLIMVGLGAMGFDVPTWREMEDYERQAASYLLGEWAGRALSLGLPAAFGWNLSPRVGMQNLLTFNEPSSTDYKDTALWTVEQGLGASMGLGEHYVKGFQDIVHGDWMEAVKNFSPLKVVTNMADASYKLAYGKTNVHGRPVDAPYTIPQAITRAIGFSPTAETEASTARSLFYTKTAGIKAERQSFLDQWYLAVPSQRGKMFGQILEWNKGRPEGEKLTRAQLDDYVRRRDRETVFGGVRMSGPADVKRMDTITGGVYGP
jgi:hypothetical protein